MAELQWQVQRPPGRGLKIISLIYAALFLIAATFMIPLLVEQSWPWYLCGGAVGLVLAGLLCHSIWQGAQCSVDQNGICTYGMHNKANLTFDLRAVSALEMVKQGPLAGVGVAIDIESIHLLHHKGISVSKMRSYQKYLGVSLVLECLNTEDCAALEKLRQSYQNGPTGSNKPSLEA